MNPFNRANELIRMLLTENAIFPIDLDNVKMDGWLYQSEYVFQLHKQSKATWYHFIIRLYEWNSESKSFKLITLRYRLVAGNKIIYVHDVDLEDSINQMANDFISSQQFISTIKPLILEGFREQAIKV